jgi:chromosome segregation ATPase
MLVRVYSAPGFNGVWRAGRKWPTEGVVVETIDDENDIEATADSPMRIGKKTITALRGDPRFTFDAGDSIDEIDDIKKSLASATRDVQELGEANKRLVDDINKVVEEKKALATENSTLKARVTELEAALKAVPKAEPKAEGKTSKTDAGK